jgi:hypothetical protein
MFERYIVQFSVVLLDTKATEDRREIQAYRSWKKWLSPHKNRFVDVRTILEWILKKESIKFRNWLNWFRIGSEGSFLPKRKWILGFHENGYFTVIINSWRDTLQHAVLLLCLRKNTWAARGRHLLTSRSFHMEQISLQGTGKGPHSGKRARQDNASLSTCNHWVQNREAGEIHLPSIQEGKI